MDYSDSIYYTFSTIAQVLAGFLALSGVFVLFKLQEFKKIQLIQVEYFLTALGKIDLKIDDFYGCPIIAIDLYTLKKSETTAGLIKELDTILIQDDIKKNPNLPKFREWNDIIKKVENRKLCLKHLTFISIITGIPTIFYSLIILGFICSINDKFSSFVILIGILSAILTILFMTCGIIISLKDFDIIAKSPKVIVKFDHSK